jgi:hypothetical protein
MASTPHDLTARAAQVLQRTALAWCIAAPSPRSPHAVARIAPRGYVPVRQQRQRRALAPAIGFLYAW